MGFFPNRSPQRKDAESRWLSTHPHPLLGFNPLFMERTEVRMLGILDPDVSFSLLASPRQVISLIRTSFKYKITEFGTVVI